MSIKPSRCLWLPDVGMNDIWICNKGFLPHLTECNLCNLRQIERGTAASLISYCSIFCSSTRTPNLWAVLWSLILLLTLVPMLARICYDVPKQTANATEHRSRKALLILEKLTAALEPDPGEPGSTSTPGLLDALFTEMAFVPGSFSKCHHAIYHKKKFQHPPFSCPRENWLIQAYLSSTQHK